MTADTREPTRDQGIIKVTSARTGRVTYEARWSWVGPDGTRHSGTKRCKTLREARSIRAQRVTEARDGTYQPATRETVGEYAARWMERMERGPWQSSTAYQRRGQYRRYIQPVLAGRRIGSVTRADCQKLVDDLAARHGLQAQTITTIHALLSGLFSAAEAEGLIASNPAKHVTLPPVRRRAPVTWTAAQVRHFLTVTRDDADHALYVLLLTTGVRIGEAQALRWESVDLDAGTVTITDTMRRQTSGSFRPMPGTKTTKARTIPLVPACVAALTRHKAQQAEQRRHAARWDIRGFVFTGEDGGTMEPETMRRHLDEAIARAGLPRITPHGFRHVFATLMLESGAHPKVVSDLLGHRTIQMTLNQYSHVGTDLSRRAVGTLSAIIEDSDEPKTNTSG